MKTMFAFFLLIMAFSCSAQKILIPYRSDTLFGISDEHSKVIVTPQYNRVEWMEGSWFRAGKDVWLKDTLVLSSGHRIFRNNIFARMSSLIHKGTIVLQDEPFGDYEIIANACIAADFDGRGEELTTEQYKKYGNKTRFVSLFNLKGTNVYPENFKRLRKVDTAGVSSRDKKATRYILFFAQHFDDSYSIFVFDTDQQKISDWLIWNADHMEQLDRSRINDKQIAFTMTDKNGAESRRVLDYRSGKFLLGAEGVPGTPAKQRKRVEQPEMVVMGRDYHDDPDAMSVPVPDEKGISAPAPAFNSYHIIIKDTLYYLTSYEDKHPVKLSAGSKIIFAEPRGVTQYQPVIVKNDGHFYIVKADKPGTVAYDSLLYFGNYFLAWKTINGQVKAGVINANDSAIVPMEYESVCADIRYLILQNQNPAGKSNYKMVFTEADERYTYSGPHPYSRTQSNVLTVFKNGLCGLISIKGETIIPVQYQMIAKNDMRYSKPKKDDFIILKQHDRYGIATLQYNQEKQHQEMLPIVKPVLDYIPGFYYPDYYHVQGYKLIGLFSNQMEFKGYASDKGEVFYTH